MFVCIFQYFYAKPNICKYSKSIGALSIVQYFWFSSTYFNYFLEVIRRWKNLTNDEKNVSHTLTKFIRYLVTARRSLMPFDAVWCSPTKLNGFQNAVWTVITFLLFPTHFNAFTGIYIIFSGIFSEFLQFSHNFFIFFLLLPTVIAAVHNFLCFFHSTITTIYPVFFSYLSIIWVSAMIDGRRPRVLKGLSNFDLFIFAQFW